MKILKVTIEYLKNRFVLFLVFLIAFGIVNLSFRGSLLPSVGTDNLWFYSGIVMALFSILFIEPYYTSPKNVITNSVPLLLVLIAIRTEFADPIIWWVAILVLTTLLLASIIALAFENKNKSPEFWSNRTSNLLKNLVVLIGQGKILYSTVFIYFLLTYNSVQNYYTLIMFVMWFFILLINPKRIKSTFVTRKEQFNENAIGEIFSVQSKKIFLVKLFEDRKGITKFDMVKFRYSMQDYDDRVITGIVFDTYLLNQEKWSKVLQLRVQKEENSYLDKNVVFKITDKDEKQQAGSELNIDNFVGVVIEGSQIGKIKFEYSKKVDDIQEGDLLELSLDKKRLFYQVVGGMTDKERLEVRNETGFVKGEAIQLGEWQEGQLSFQKFGWVPTINTPIFKADTSDIAIQKYTYPEYKLGVIPGTLLPSVINLREAVSHHMALLGVTGAGKTFIAREIIKELMTDTKVICVDFTGEYKTEFDSLNPTYLIDKDGLFKVEEIIAKKETATKMKNSTDVLKYKKEITDKLSEYINSFMEDKNTNLGIFEIPDLSNSAFILEFTQMFLDCVFRFAKANNATKTCIVIEEAHTVIPESSFIGEGGDFGYTKGLVNKMSQIALQGRKYGVGLFVIAQRTANVSKTVLTQCNTIICFQAFDETSFNFLSNYIGKDLVQTLPNLKQYHAIVTGKAVKSNIPMIINLERKTEDN